MALTYGKIRIQCDIPIQSIHKLEINEEPNQHAKIRIEGYGKSEEVEPAIQLRTQEQVQGTGIIIKELDDAGTEKRDPVFQGFIRNVEAVRENQTTKVIVQGVSGTWVLDDKRECRSFQDVSMTYADVIRAVLSRTERSAVIMSDLAGQRIQKPFIQYQETDWEFLKRISSHLDGCIIPDVVTGYANLWFGMKKETKPATLNEDIYKAGFSGKFHDRTDLPASSRSDFFYYIVSSLTNCNLGDNVIFKGRNLRVIRKKTTLSGDRLTYCYTLGNTVLCSNKPYYNQTFRGLSLSGTVMDTEGEDVCLKLDIDGEDGTASYPWRWSPITGNMMYCMPQIGTKVQLGFDGCDEREAFAYTSIRSELSREVQNRTMTSEHGKRLDLFPGSLSLIGGGSHSQANQISLKDHSQTLFSSSGSIQIAAAGAVRITAPRVVIQSPTEVDLIQAAVSQPEVSAGTGIQTAVLHNIKDNNIPLGYTTGTGAGRRRYYAGFYSDDNKLDFIASTTGTRDTFLDTASGAALDKIEIYSKGYRYTGEYKDENETDGNGNPYSKRMYTYNRVTVTIKVYRNANIESTHSGYLCDNKIYIITPLLLVQAFGYKITNNADSRTGTIMGVFM